MTKKGYTLVREQNCFYVLEQRIMYESASKESYAEDFYHSQLAVFVGASKAITLTLVELWLSFYQDHDLIDQARTEIDLLFDQRKTAEATPPVEDVDVN